MTLSIDTSLLVAAERGHSEAIAIFREWDAKGWVGFVSSVALSEWLVGVEAVRDDAKRAKARRFYDTYLSTLPVHPLTEEDAIVYGQSIGRLRAKGTTVDFADGLIGCQALRYGVPVATYNVRHFAQIPGLEVVSPNEKAPDDDVEGQKD